MNPDMQGYVVRVSNFVTHLGAAILITWSNKNPRRYYAMLFLQIVFILIGVFASIGRDQLNVDDAQFAIILTHSPTCAYYVLLVLPRLFLKTLPARARSVLNNPKLLPTEAAPAWNQLLTELNCQPVTDGLCAALIVLICLALNVSVQSNGLTHLYQTEDSEIFQIPSATAATVVYRWLLLGGISVPVYECVLARHAKLRWKLTRRLAARDAGVKYTFNWKRRVRGFFATWYIAVKLHPWIPFLYAAVMFEHWARKLSIWTVESDFVFSFGQFLALGPSVPVALECLALAIHRRSDIANIPKSFYKDVIWIITGTGQAWGGDDPDLRDVWNAFPADELPPEPELPFTTINPEPSFPLPDPSVTRIVTTRNPRPRRCRTVTKGSQHKKSRVKEMDVGRRSIA
ncbi:hypothetical protein DFH09DRAFT_324615 [Mycena vulgaris]|nr:hypothetical protein DFH09DRAFT_324615 [Mycena vulgaris]